MYLQVRNAFKEFFTKKTLSLQERMNNKNDIRCNPRNICIVSLKSKRLLKFINNVGIYEDKIHDLNDLNSKLVKVCKTLFEYFNPNVIYFFNNEIHLCFGKCNDNETYLFGGDTLKIVTTIASFATKTMIEEDVQGCVFEATIRNFEQDFEALNFLIWRQLDCRRNNYTLLYKCKNLDNYLNNKLNVQEKMLKEIVQDFDAEFENVHKQLIFGNIMKKAIVYKVTGDQVISRKEYQVEHFKLEEKFKETLQKYILNKLA
jgi:hypothetical protein